MKQHTILLVDDHILVRAGIRSLIDKIDGFSVIAEASDLQEARQHLQHAVPDIVVTDITLGDENGLHLAKEVKDAYPQTSVIVISMHTSDEIAMEALRVGASSYLVKESAPAELEIALQAVTRGGVYLSPAVSGGMIRRLSEAPSPTPNISVLTSRQVQILTLIAQRKSTKEIAFELELSEKTVAAHRAQIMDRLGVRDVVGLAMFAIKHGLVKGGE